MHFALLTGGISSERPISLKSSEGIQSFLQEAGHTYDIYDIPEQIDDFLSKYREYDMIFPYIHWFYGEDGIITWLCETIWLKFIGSPATTHALCINKFYTNCVVEKLGIVKVPKSWVPGINSPTLLGLPENVVDDQENTKVPSLIVKPNCGGSTVATNKVHSIPELMWAIQVVKNNNDLLMQSNQIALWTRKDFTRHFHFSDSPIIQEFVEGIEYTVWVVWKNESPEVLPIMQIVNLGSAIFDWQEKYESDGSNEIFPENIDPTLESRLKNISKTIYTMLGCRGVSRIDFIVSWEDIYFLEINTFPGVTTSSFIPKMWKKSGKNMSEFVELLIQSVAQ